MKSTAFYSALGAVVLASSGLAQAAVTLQIISDNDFAVFVGTSTSVTRLVYQNNESWPAQTAAAGSFSFGFQAGETTVYLLGMGAGGEENIGGRMNGVDITTINVSQSSSLSGYLTNYTTTSVSVLDSGAFVATLQDVSTALQNLTWGSTTIIDYGVGSNVTGSAFEYQVNSAPLFRFSAADIGVTVPAVPEPGVTMLGLAAGLILVSRRRRQVA
ncbi:PEP-CTERM sorting domain-containing protein [bacterium]|nr:PEP-CTERM sorting domain-containing protein [bacterium]